MEGSIIDIIQIEGVLSVGELSGAVSFTDDISVDVEIPKTISPRAYEGPYEVTPKKDEDQTLLTSGMKMTDDVTVYEIPYWKTSNPQGGRTVYIGVI